MDAVKVTSEDLIRLPLGSKTIIKCEDARKCESIVSLAYRVPKRYPEMRDRRYRCHINYITSEITIQVIPITVTKGLSRKK